MYKNKKVILIVPVFNEEKRIGLVVERAKETMFDEVCVVDDGSTDQSAEIAQNYRVTVLSCPQRKKRRLPGHF